MRILGISAYYHDSAAALIRRGEVIAAAQEERFSRIKHDSNFPRKAIEYCLEEAGCTLTDVDYVVFYDKPFLKFERLLETYLAFAPRGFKSFAKAMPIWLREKLFQKNMLRDELRRYDPGFDPQERLLFSKHHLSHAASAFFCSPFEKAVVLTMDGVGEWATSSVAIGDGNALTTVKELHFPHSLGLLYSAVTYYLGFKVNSGEYKVMGLAPYGEPKYAKLMKEHLINIKPDGSFRLDMRYFNYCVGLTMTNAKFSALFGEPVRTPEHQLTKFHMDVAASVQAVTEEIVLKMADALAQETGIDNLCLAGGVALNCVANGKILKDQSFKNIWVQPAAGDSGGALGAALAAYHIHFNEPRTPGDEDNMKGSYLGPSFVQNDIEQRFDALGAVYSVLEESDLISKCSTALKDQKVVGWFQGRMEFGPRSLGARSILGDPRAPSMQKTVNLKVKYRESFRPFAPAVLREDVSDWFDLEADSPYMLIVADVKKSRQRATTTEEQDLFGIEKLYIPRSEIPAVTHVDYSARIQTVHSDTNPMFHELLSHFKADTGCPVLLNTSFNVRGEPIVCTPEDAYRCFMGTDIDVLVVGNCILHKADQPAHARLDYKDNFELD
ncbi:carbamoyltransferase [Magnetovibrio sp. PR-2]|uniref:carbamoyltransferase family protein n=1 Tax=Magnetovibrio sp. PR-2 TaxID=3120356 RepID=UPI002FCE3A02